MFEVEQQIRRFIVDTFLFAEENPQLGNESSMLDEGIIDSTGVLQLVAFLESQFGIRVDDNELIPDNLDSVSRLIRFIDLKTRVAAR